MTIIIHPKTTWLLQHNSKVNTGPLSHNHSLVGIGQEKYLVRFWKTILVWVHISTVLLLLLLQTYGVALDLVLGEGQDEAHEARERIRQFYLSYEIL